ncbi:MAG TPA: OsmC family peroxiredoxin [Chromatiaceae bacterium]|nr:OsmC family peroxiredoxin [Chromatiaceae bacterium]
MKPVSTYRVTARHLDAHGSEARCKDARLTLDTDPAGRDDAFNPAELLLAALAACMIKNIERVAPILQFSFRDIRIHLNGQRRDKPPAMERIDYEIVIDTDESDKRLELLHRNVRGFGTVYNTLAAGCELAGTLRRGNDDAGQ